MVKGMFGKYMYVCVCKGKNILVEKNKVKGKNILVEKNKVKVRDSLSSVEVEWLVGFHSL